MQFHILRTQTLVRIIVPLFLLALFSIALPSYASGITMVGSCDECDYASIQDAIDALGNEGYIELQEQTYIEDIIVPAGEWIIAGDVTDYNASKIKGKITVQKGADLEFQYILLNAKGKKYGMVVKGDATVKYGTIKNAKQANILVTNNGQLDTYDLVVREGKKHGILAKKNGKLTIELTRVVKNAAAGIRSTSERRVRLGEECVVGGNTRGLSLKNHHHVNSEVTSALFKNNTVGVYLDNSHLYLDGATYRNNDVNLVEVN